MKVLFVCEGNAARSQMAQAFYNNATRSTDAESAGTIVDITGLVPPKVILVMNELGIPMDAHFRKQITREMFDAAERVILMTQNSLPDYLQGDKVTFWDVDDPRHKEMDVFYRVRGEIQKKVEELIADDERKTS